MYVLELQTKVREDITENAPIRGFSWLKTPANAFTFKTQTNNNYRPQSVLKSNIYNIDNRQ